MSEAAPAPAASAAANGDTAGVKVPPPLFYVAGFLIGVAIEAAVPVERPPAWVAIAGAVIGLGAWLYLDGGAMREFRRAKTKLEPWKPSTALVTSGPYRLTRNPIYIGMALGYIGIAFALGLVWPLAVLPVVLVTIDRLVIAREEPYLERRFGEAYREYKRRVRRWI